MTGANRTREPKMDAIIKMDAINKASSVMEAGLSAGLSAAKKTTNQGLSAVTNTANLTKIAAKTVTLSATASYGAYHGSKEVGTALFSSMAEQIPGYEKHTTGESPMHQSACTSGSLAFVIPHRFSTRLTSILYLQPRKLSRKSRPRYWLAQPGSL